MPKKSIFFKGASLLIVVCFFINSVIPPQAFAQGLIGIPATGTLVPLSPGFTPPLIRGLRVYPDNPLKFDFIVDAGDSGLKGVDLKQESEKLIKYFLASLTIPEEDLWVNLSPHEKDRIIPTLLGQTEMGKDMLYQDYLLKQITASLIYPEDELGKQFWQKVYKKAYEQYGTSNIPVDTFNKVWILPDKALVYEHQDRAFVVESHLKVMLEEDYVALQHSSDSSLVVSDSTESRTPNPETRNKLATEIIREIILPAIETEVNTGKNFSQLRQIYNSLILAYWFKNNLKEAVLNQIYSGKNKIKGVDIEDKDISQKIYSQYLESIKKGAYNLIKSEYDPNTNEVVPRKYFSGGAQFAKFDMQKAFATTPNPVDAASLIKDLQSSVDVALMTTELKPLDLSSPTEAQTDSGDNALLVNMIPPKVKIDKLPIEKLMALDSSGKNQTASKANQANYLQGLIEDLGSRVLGKELSSLQGAAANLRKQGELITYAASNTIQASLQFEYDQYLLQKKIFDMLGVSRQQAQRAIEVRRGEQTEVLGESKIENQDLNDFVAEDIELVSNEDIRRRLLTAKNKFAENLTPGRTEEIDTVLYASGEDRRAGMISVYKKVIEDLMPRETQIQGILDEYRTKVETEFNQRYTSEERKLILAYVNNDSSYLDFEEKDRVDELAFEEINQFRQELVSAQYTRSIKIEGISASQELTGLHQYAQQFGPGKVSQLLKLADSVREKTQIQAPKTISKETLPPVRVTKTTDGNYQVVLSLPSSMMQAGGSPGAETSKQIQEEIAQTGKGYPRQFPLFHSEADKLSRQTIPQSTDFDLKWTQTSWQQALAGLMSYKRGLFSQIESRSRSMASDETLKLFTALSEQEKIALEQLSGIETALRATEEITDKVFDKPIAGIEDFAKRLGMEDKIGTLEFDLMVEELRDTPLPEKGTSVLELMRSSPVFTRTVLGAIGVLLVGGMLYQINKQVASPEDSRMYDLSIKKVANTWPVSTTVLDQDYGIAPDSLGHSKFNVSWQDRMLVEPRMQMTHNGDALTFDLRGSQIKPADLPQVQAVTDGVAVTPTFYNPADSVYQTVLQFNIDDLKDKGIDKIKVRYLNGEDITYSLDQIQSQAKDDTIDSKSLEAVRNFNEAQNRDTFMKKLEVMCGQAQQEIRRQASQNPNYYNEVGGEEGIKKWTEYLEGFPQQVQAYLEQLEEYGVESEVFNDEDAPYLIMRGTVMGGILGYPGVGGEYLLDRTGIFDQNQMTMLSGGRQHIPDAIDFNTAYFSDNSGIRLMIPLMWHEFSHKLWDPEIGKFTKTHEGFVDWVSKKATLELLDRGMLPDSTKVPTELGYSAGVGLMGIQRAMLAKMLGNSEAGDKLFLNTYSHQFEEEKVNEKISNMMADALGLKDQERADFIKAVTVDAQNANLRNPHEGENIAIIKSLTQAADKQNISLEDLIRSDNGLNDMEAYYSLSAIAEARAAAQQYDKAAQALESFISRYQSDYHSLAYMDLGRMRGEQYKQSKDENHYRQSLEAFDRALASFDSRKDNHRVNLYDKASIHHNRLLVQGSVLANQPSDSLIKAMEEDVVTALNDYLTENTIPSKLAAQRLFFDLYKIFNNQSEMSDFGDFMQQMGMGEKAALTPHQLKFYEQYFGKDFAKLVAEGKWKEAFAKLTDFFRRELSGKEQMGQGFDSMGEAEGGGADQQRYFGETSLNDLLKRIAQMRGSNELKLQEYEGAIEQSKKIALGTAARGDLETASYLLKMGLELAFDISNGEKIVLIDESGKVSESRSLLVSTYKKMAEELPEELMHAVDRRIYHTPNWNDLPWEEREKTPQETIGSWQFSFGFLAKRYNEPLFLERGAKFYQQETKSYEPLVDKILSEQALHNEATGLPSTARDSDSRTIDDLRTMKNIAEIKKLNYRVTELANDAMNFAHSRADGMPGMEGLQAVAIIQDNQKFLEKAVKLECQNWPPYSKNEVMTVPDSLLNPESYNNHLELIAIRREIAKLDNAGFLNNRPHVKQEIMDGLYWDAQIRGGVNYFTGDGPGTVNALRDIYQHTGDLTALSLLKTYLQRLDDVMRENNLGERGYQVRVVGQSIFYYLNIKGRSAVADLIRENPAIESLPMSADNWELFRRKFVQARIDSEIAKLDSSDQERLFTFLNRMTPSADRDFGNEELSWGGAYGELYNSSESIYREAINFYRGISIDTLVANPQSYQREGEDYGSYYEVYDAYRLSGDLNKVKFSEQKNQGQNPEEQRGKMKERLNIDAQILFSARFDDLAHRFSNQQGENEALNQLLSDALDIRARINQESGKDSTVYYGDALMAALYFNKAELSRTWGLDSAQADTRRFLEYFQKSLFSGDATKDEMIEWIRSFMQKAWPEISSEERHRSMDGVEFFPTILDQAQLNGFTELYHYLNPAENQDIANLMPSWVIARYASEWEPAYLKTIDQDNQSAVQNYYQHKFVQNPTKVNLKELGQQGFDLQDPKTLLDLMDETQQDELNGHRKADLEEQLAYDQYRHWQAALQDSSIRKIEKQSWWGSRGGDFDPYVHNEISYNHFRAMTAHGIDSIDKAQWKAWRDHFLSCKKDFIIHNKDGSGKLDKDKYMQFLFHFNARVGHELRLSTILEAAMAMKDYDFLEILPEAYEAQMKFDLLQRNGNSSELETKILDLVTARFKINQAFAQAGDSRAMDAAKLYQYIQQNLSSILQDGLDEIAAQNSDAFLNEFIGVALEKIDLSALIRTSTETQFVEDEVVSRLSGLKDPTVAIQEKPELLTEIYQLKAEKIWKLLTQLKRGAQITITQADLRNDQIINAELQAFITQLRINMPPEIKSTLRDGMAADESFPLEQPVDGQTHMNPFEEYIKYKVVEQLLEIKRQQDHGTFDRPLYSTETQAELPEFTTTLVEDAQGRLFTETTKDGKATSRVPENMDSWVSIWMREINKYGKHAVIDDRFREHYPRLTSELEKRLDLEIEQRSASPVQQPAKQETGDNALLSDAPASFPYYMLEASKIVDGKMQRVEINSLVSKDQARIPDMFAYSADTEQGPSLLGIYIAKDLRGEVNNLRLLLATFFDAFKNVERTHPNLINPILLVSLVDHYGFELEEPSTAPNAFLGRTRYNGKRQIYFVDEATQQLFFKKMPGGAIDQYIAVDKREDIVGEASPLYLGVPLVLKDREKFEETLSRSPKMPKVIEKQPSPSQLSILLGEADASLLTGPSDAVFLAAKSPDNVLTEIEVRDLRVRVSEGDQEAVKDLEGIISALKEILLSQEVTSNSLKKEIVWALVDLVSYANSQTAAESLMEIILIEKINKDLKEEIAEALKVSAQSKRSQLAYQTLEKIAGALLKQFQSTLEIAGGAFDIQGRLSESRKIFGYVLKTSGFKAGIRIHEIAAVRAAKALMEATGLDKETVVIGYDWEIDGQEAERQFPGYVIEKWDNKNEYAVSIQFHDSVFSYAGRNYDLPYSPLKFGLPERVPQEKISQIKSQLNINGRKVIALGSLFDSELEEFMAVYNNLYSSLSVEKRPLIIYAPRDRDNKPEYSIPVSLSSQKERVRDNPDLDFEDMSEHNVLILGTKGELLTLYAVADICIVGNDRNILEPASQTRQPVLYFEGHWINNKEAKEALVEAEGALQFNELVFRMQLDNPDFLAMKSFTTIGAGVVSDFKNNRIPAIANKFSTFALPELLLEAIEQGGSPSDAQTPGGISGSTASLDKLGTSLTIDAKAENTGGIDLNPSNLDLQTKGEGVEFNLPAELQGMDLNNIEGLTPVIINIVPVTNFYNLLGLEESEKSYQSSAVSLQLLKTES